MPTGFVTDDQARRYGCFVGEPTPGQLARHFHLDDADRAFVAEHRGEPNRLGVAIQLGSVRLLGTFLDDPAEAPTSAVRYAAAQLAIEDCTEAIAAYAASEGRWRHGPRIRRRYGYQRFADGGIAFRLHRFLYALRAAGYEVRLEDVAHLSPLGYTHVNMPGRYAFTLPDTVARGEIRPLRDPRAVGPDDP